MAQPLMFHRTTKQSNQLRHLRTDGHINLSLRGAYPGFSFTFAYPHFVPLNSTKKVLENYGDHPFKAKFQRRYDHIDSAIMWPSFTSSLMDFRKGIQRSIYRKRLRRAFFAALLGEGLDHNGRKLDDSGCIIPGVASPIRGSIKLTLLPGFPDLTTSELEVNCTKVIRRVASKWAEVEK